jgi:hypothetical protein
MVDDHAEPELDIPRRVMPPPAASQTFDSLHELEQAI